MSNKIEQCQENAETVLANYTNMTGSDGADAVADLLADLMHYCDRQGIAFEIELETAQDNYRTERNQYL